MAQDSLFRPQFALKIPLQGEKSGFFLPSEGCKASAFHQFLIFCKRLTAPSHPLAARLSESSCFYQTAQRAHATALLSPHYAVRSFYGGGCKLSPRASEKHYGGSVALLRSCCSIAPELPEKVYGQPGKYRQGTYHVPIKSKTWSVYPISASHSDFLHCSFIAYSPTKVHPTQYNRVSRAAV